ncbi:MAG: Y4yA family PLP-dependent enzyme [Brachybacterium sp.]|nr:Y4yA family PLP-dependent enzyme [Brachybacterium sp.]
MTTTEPAAPPREDSLRTACQGTPPLTARLEPWMRELLSDPEACDALLETHGSPVNVHDVSALARNAEEMLAVARELDVPMRLFIARKANKTLGVVDAARAAGHGIDVGSENELRQVLDRGVAPDDIVLTSAIKPRRLLDLALGAGVPVALDTLDEAALAQEVAASTARSGPSPVALRLAPAPSELIAPTRFGESAATWSDWAARLSPSDSGLRIDGVHFHLHGYDAAARTAAIAEALGLIDQLRELGHRPGFLDIGGGVPMSYLDDAAEWDAFWAAMDAPEASRPSWRGDPLRPVYPYHQAPTRGEWLRTVLTADVAPGISAAEALQERSIELRAEPGRAMLDGCGMTLARVVQRTTTSDGIPVIGLAMNRTQCRSTSADFLLDPILVRPASAGAPSDAIEGFLVGAYCIEEELILRRRLRFGTGVAVGDIIAIPNTGGYLMHILESASHQIPLAVNVTADGSGGYARDDIDA